MSFSLQCNILIQNEFLLGFFFFAGLGSFPTSQTEEIKCEEFKHCKVECRHKPTCLPESQCKVEWKIGEGTKTNVEINKRVGVDGNGL